MPQQNTINIIQTLKASLTENPNLRPLFAFLYSGKYKSNTFTVEKLLSITKNKIERIQLVHFIKNMDNLGLGYFLAGRRGTPSRFTFKYTPESIGHCVLGHARTLEPIIPTFEATVIVPQKHVPFQVKHSAAGTLFLLPSDSKESDAKQLAKYIRKMGMETNNKVMTA